MHKKNIGSVSYTIKARRLLWILVYYAFFRMFPTRLFWPWRWLLLRLFGANVSFKALVYSSVDIWAPWNLKMEDHSCLGPHVICYNQAMVTLEEYSTVSQYACLCTAGHDTSEINNKYTSLVIAPITICRNAWVAMKAFVGMGVIVGERSIVGATASVFKDVAPFTVVGGNPAKIINQIKK